MKQHTTGKGANSYSYLNMAIVEVDGLLIDAEDFDSLNDLNNLTKGMKRKSRLFLTSSAFSKFGDLLTPAEATKEA